MGFSGGTGGNMKNSIAEPEKMTWIKKRNEVVNDISNNFRKGTTHAKQTKRDGRRIFCEAGIRKEEEAGS